MSKDNKLESAEPGKTGTDLMNVMQSIAVSRRKLLASLGLAGVAMAAASIPQTAYADNDDEDNANWKELIYGQIGVNVKRFGAHGNGTANDAAAIQSAINSLLPTGGIVFFPAGTYLVGSPIVLASNITLQGVDKELCMIRDHQSLGAQRLVSVEGTPEARLANIKLRDLTFRNGDALPMGTPPLRNKDGIEVFYTDGFTLERCKLTEIAGHNSLSTKFSTNIYVESCLFYRFSYSGVAIGVECENIMVLGSTFDTVTTTSNGRENGQAYLFCTGGDTLNQGNNWPKNIWVENNIFRNNRYWEGVDTHGCDNIWILNNYVENCRVGILVANAMNYVANPGLRNAVVDNNIVIKGDAAPNGYGIVSQGSEGLWAEGVTISNNVIDGFGFSDTQDAGAIHIKWMNKFTITRNIVDHYYQNGIMLYSACYQGTITNNEFRNCSGGLNPATTNAIRVGINGIFGVEIENNVVNPNDVTQFPSYFLSCTSVRGSASVQVKNNTVHHIGTAKYRNPNFMNIGWADMPADDATNGISQKFGDVIYNTAGKPAWYVNSPEIGYGSTYTGVVDTASIEIGSRIMTVSNFQLSKSFPQGMNIRIAGAGPGGADLLARVIRNVSAARNLVEIDTEAGTTVTGANVHYQGLTFTT